MESKLQALKVPELKRLLQDANLTVSGTKVELIKRLLENPTAISSLGGGEEEDLLGEYEADVPAEKEPAKAPAPAAPAASIVAKPKSIQAAAANATSKPIPEAPTQSEEEKKVALIVELEKRKARAARWGLPTADVEAKLQRAIKFGIDANQDPTLDKLEGGLKGGKKREVKGEKKEEDAGSKVTADKKHPAPKPIETEEEKAARIARQEADEAAKKRRAERFGIPTIEKSAATANAVQSPAIADPAEEERKRKRMEKFGSAPSAEPADKKIKA